MKYLIILLLLTSCSTTSLMSRYLKRGGKIEQVETPVMVPYLLKGVDGQDSIAYREITITCPDPVIETRWETKWKTKIKYRFDNRRFNDSLDHYKDLYLIGRKYDLRTDKDDGKTDRTDIKQGAKVEKNENNNETKQIKAKWNVWIILTSLVMGWLLPKIAQRAWKKWK